MFIVRIERFSLGSSGIEAEWVIKLFPVDSSSFSISSLCTSSLTPTRFTKAVTSTELPTTISYFRLEAGLTRETRYRAAAAADAEDY